MPLTTPFTFASCNVGSETSLKADIARSHGKLLTPAFMRPGLITWKSKEDIPNHLVLESVFARISGFSLGLCQTPEAIASQAAPLGLGPLHVHAFPRLPPEDESAAVEWSRIDSLREYIVSTLTKNGNSVHSLRTPKFGDWILDLIFEPDSVNCLAGLHRHRPGAHTLPGALPRLTFPLEAPSRAYLKMEQVLAWQGLAESKSLAGLTAVELGCAPGGASYSLVKRGVNVLGVDTGVMDERVLGLTGPQGARFTHLNTTAGALISQPLPPKIDLLISDMNLAPPVVLKYVEALQHRLRAKILIVTLKLNDRSLEAKIPLYLKHFTQFAPGPVYATQLPANRREISLFSQA